MPFSVPVIWHVRDFLGARSSLGPLLQLAAFRARTAIAVSNAVMSDTRKLLPNLSVETIHDGIDLQHFTPNAVARDPGFLDQLAGLPSAPVGTRRIGLVAVFARWKGQDAFLRAVAELKRVSPATFSRTRFYVIGGPIYQTAGSQFSLDELRSLATSLGVSERVGFVPFDSDPAPLYRALDVVVHASTRPEPFGRTVAEAMACGRAVAASASGGSGELFTDGLDGVAITPTDSYSFARTMANLLEDDDCRQRLGSAATASAHPRFSRQSCAQKVSTLYARVIDARPIEGMMSRG